MTEKILDKTSLQGIHLLNKGYQIKSLITNNITPLNMNIINSHHNTHNTHHHHHNHHNNHQPLYINSSIIESKVITYRILDGFALLEASNLGFPEDSRRITIPSLGYSSVIYEDLLFFINLIYLDISDNYFSFHSFECLNKLKELRIVCNEIINIDEINGYPSLQILDLSYNKLTQDSIISLTTLTNLKELDLSGNNLLTLPTQLSLFVNLERLILEHNKLSDNEIFYSLSLIPNLRELDLAFNLLSVIPSQCCQNGNFR